MKGILIAIAAIAAAHPFALDFSDDDRSYGHHGKPAEYKAMDGIVHPWREADERRNVVVSDPLAALHALWLEDMGRLDYELADTVGVMDPFNDLHLHKEPSVVDSDAEEDLAMLTIMESTPDMCPLCAKEGHALGHDAHKKLLARLREKLVGEDKAKKQKEEEKKQMEEEKKMMLGCELCMAEGSTRNHEEHMAVKASSCPLCRAEGTMEHHAKHAALLSLAQELSFKPKPSSAGSSGCRLCRAEGSTRNHSKHTELARMAERKSSMRGPESLRRMLELLGEHEDLAIAAKAEAQWARDRRQRTQEMTFEFVFDDDMDTDMDMMDMDMGIFASMPYDMMKMKRAEPLRDFHRRAGEPADDMDDEDEDDDEEESLFDRIIRNIRDLLGLDEDSMYARMDEPEGTKDLAGIIAMLLLLFVGLLLVSFGLVELLSVLMGEEGANGKAYEPLSFDAEERMILDMEDGMAMSMRSKGAISI